jgi:hypothetical protein
LNAYLGKLGYDLGLLLFNLWWDGHVGCLGVVDLFLYLLLLLVSGGECYCLALLCGLLFGAY